MMWIKLIITTALLCVVIATVATDTAEEDLIIELPGLEVQPEFKQYSGYVTADGDRQLHYWLVESQNDPVTDPLILWLNGGPGCSSISGFLDEHGPFAVDANGTSLKVNPHSWNENASVVYLESPAGVGYSFSPDNDIKTGDYHSAENNYFAMRSFFEKFPAFKGRDFYITGESYAGIYVPLLANWVTSDDDMNLKGIAIGNGVLDLSFKMDSLPQMLYSHGMISTDLWVMLRSQCCSEEHAFGCSFTSSLTNNPSVCKKLLESVINLSWTSGVNPYNVLDACAGGAESVMDDGKDNNHRARMNYKFDKKNVRFLAKLTAKVSSTNENQRSVRHARESEDTTDDEIEENVISCLNDTLTTMYMNLPEVRQALHIPDHLPPWLICNDNITTGYVKSVSTVKTEIKTLLSKNIRVLIYNGDTDLTCNLIGNGWFVSDLNLKGAGHFVPSDKPSLALHVINSFIRGEDY